MSKYHEINDKIEAAAERARQDKGTKTDEEIKRDFFKVAAELYDEHVAGDVTLVDGREVHIPKINEIEI